MWGEGEEKFKNCKIIYRTSQNLRITNLFLESLLSESLPSQKDSPPHLPSMPSNSVLISGPTVGAPQILIWFSFYVSCHQCSQLSELVHFL